MEKVTELVSSNDLTFLPKPFANPKLQYAKPYKGIWVNNYLLKFSKELNFLEFAVEFNPEIGRENKILKERIFKHVNLSDISNDKLSLFTGDALFLKIDSDQKLKDFYEYEIDFKLNKTKYVIKLRNTKKTFNLNSEYKLNYKPAYKMLFELLVNQVIRNNPNIEVYKKLFVKINEKKTIKSNRGNLDFFPGYSTSVNLLKEGIFLTVALRNRFLSNKTCYEILKECSDDKEQIIEKFGGSSVKTTYSKKDYQVSNVCFDKNALNTIITYSGAEVNLVKYYEKAHSVKITDPKQPLFEVQQRDGSKIYLIPELCLLSGIDDSMVKDRNFMQELATFTKFEPEQRVKMTSSFFALMNEAKFKFKADKEGKVIFKAMSPKETCDKIGLSLANTERIIDAYAIEDPKIKSGNKSLAFSKLDRNQVHDNALQKIADLLVVYHKSNTNQSYTFYDLIQSAGKEYGLKSPEPTWAEVNSNNPKDWIAEVEKYDTKKYKMVVFIINGRLESLYKFIKSHSLSSKGKGYLSQVIKAESIMNEKRALSIASKVMCQINNKLGGCSYALNVDASEYKATNLMIIGVDSSHISGQRTGVALVATTSKDYSKTISQEDILEEKVKTQLVFSVGRFIDTALKEYFKNTKELPKGIIIYRQGVSAEQKEYLKDEVANIDNHCKGLMDTSVNKGLKIPYLYVIVNKKTNYKFFEKSGTKFNNPSSGLLITDGATDGSKFEFFIQPQKVTQGSATPTHYHVAFGDLKLNEVIPRLTYDLCSIYPNWPGPVRVPHVLKLAEKLAKMVSKTIKCELHNNVKCNPCYL